MVQALVRSQEVLQRILLLRGERVLLGPDLAMLYGVETKVLMQAVQRNRDRFPPDFMFQLDQREWTNLKSQFVTSSWGGTRKRPHAFTEQGVAMLSSVLRSPRAIAVNVEIMRAFVRMRRLLAEHADLAARLDRLEQEYDGKFRVDQHGSILGFSVLRVSALPPDALVVAL
ncbi:MAG: ORF6N domain-containing protein [Gemmatimonadales bacterium]